MFMNKNSNQTKKKLQALINPNSSIINLTYKKKINKNNLLNQFKNLMLL